MQSLLTLQTPHLRDYGELVKVWEDSVRATHDFLPGATSFYCANRCCAATSTQ